MVPNNSSSNTYSVIIGAADVTVTVDQNVAVGSITNNGNLEVIGGNSLAIYNGFVLNGTLTLQSIDSGGASVYFFGTQTLSGTGRVEFTASGTYVNNIVYARGLDGSSPATLTIGPGITIRGGRSGSIQGYYGSDTLVNQGTISADTADQTITVSAADWVNNGLLQAKNGGTLNLRGLDNTGKTLALDVSGGYLRMDGKGIKGGTLTCSGGGVLRVLSGLLDAVTMNADMMVSGSTLSVQNGMVLNGTLTLQSIDSAGASVHFLGTQTLSGTGGVEFTAGGTYVSNVVYSRSLDGSSPATLTIGPGITIRGSHNGTIQGYYGIDTLVNQGTISAATANQTITIIATGWVNNGLLQAKNGGTLNLGGTFTIAGLGTYNSIGGTIYIAGTLDNTGKTLALAATTGSLTLSGTLKGGNVTAAGGAQLIAAGGTLDGVTLNCDMTVSGNRLNVVNGLTLNGTLTLNSIDYAGAFLTFQGTQTLSGTGQVVFTAAGSYEYNYLYCQGDGSSNPATLTIGPGITIRGTAGGTIAGSYANDTLVNQGTIIADTADKIITIRGANWTNLGQLLATNGGRLNLGGTFATTGLGTYNSVGGTIYIAGTLDNTGRTLALTPATGSLSLSTTIKGGTVTATGGVQLIAAGGTLDGVTIDCDVTVSGNRLNVLNGLTLNGTLTLNSIDYAGAFLTFQGTQTLSGTGQVVFTAAGSFIYNYLYSEGDGGSNPADLTITGITIRAHRSGYIGGINQNDTVLCQASIDVDSGATLNFNGSVRLEDPERLAILPDSTIRISGNLLRATQNGDQYKPQGSVRMEGSGTAGSPQLVEAMSQDLGADATGFALNFTYATLALGNGSYIRLVDQSDNSPGSQVEALYANSIIVPAGTTLDLNGLHLYARLVQVGGTVTGGNIVQIPGGGPITMGAPVPGAIDAAGKLDEWTFFGRAGQAVTVAVNPGGNAFPAPPSPFLVWAEVLLLDDSGNVLATGSTSSANQVVVLSDIALTSDKTYRIQVHAPAGYTSSTGNYMVAAWDVTPQVTPMVMNDQLSGTIDTPYSVVRWTFSATAGQQLRLDLLATSNSGIAFELAGPGGWVGFTGISGSSDLVTLPSSGTYTVTARGTGGQYGVSFSFKLRETAQTNLTLGAVYNGTFAGSGQAHILVVDVPSTTPVQVLLNDNSSLDRNELYVKFGVPPTRGDFDYRFSTASAANQKVVVPMATAGKWYLLVYGEYVPSPSTYTVLAAASGIILTDVTPAHLANNADMTLSLAGAGFDSTTAVQLLSSSGSAYTAAVVQADSFTQITSTFSAITVPPGIYSLRVSNPGGDLAQLSNAFEVLPSGEAKLETTLIVPSSLGYHTTATIYVEYRNTGTLAMPAPLLVVTASQNDREGALLTLHPLYLTQGYWTSAIPTGFSHSVQILASGDVLGVLRPGESFRVPVYYAGWQQPWDMSYPEFKFSLGVLRADDNTPADWASLKDGMRPATVNTQAWDALWTSFTAQVGTTWGDYVRMLDDNATYLARLGQNVLNPLNPYRFGDPIYSLMYCDADCQLSRRVLDVGQFLAFEFLQADGLNPLHSLAGSADAGVEAPGLPLVFTRSFGLPISQRFELGPLGRGWSHNWQLSLQKEADGTVTVLGPGGSRRTFKPDSRGSSYFALPGDYGTLNATSGGFELQEKSGLVYAFRFDGNLNYVQDPNGNRITAGYTNALLTSLVHSSGASLQIAYNAGGRIQSIADQLGRRTLFSYDGGGEHLVGAQYYDGRTSTYSYSLAAGAAQHALTEANSSCCDHRYFDYDVQGRLTGTRLDGDAEAVTFAYDAGKVTVTNALGQASRFYFDHRGLVVKTEDALGNTVHLGIDLRYDLIAMTDPAGRSYGYAYDIRGNLVQSTNASGSITRFAYTPQFNRLASVFDAKNNGTNYSYDANGNLQSITYANGSRESWGYDASGNATTWTNRRGRAMGYSYDAAGRLKSKTYADGSRVDCTYDNRGNLVQAIDATGTTTLEYDNTTDRMTKITYPGNLWLQFIYDAAGRRVSSLDQLGHRLDYAYDAVGRLQSLKNESGATVVTYVYNVAGRLSQKTLGNGVYTTYEYDAAGQVLHLINYKSDNTILSRFDYTYDSRGRRTSMDTSYGLWTYQYDDIGQLTRAVLASTDSQISNQDLKYVYDALGNRIQTVENGVTTDYSTNNMNQYTQVGNTTYTFDADGNLIRELSPAGITTYTYSDESHLLKIQSGSNTWQNAYNAFGDREASAENGTTTRYLIDPIGLANLVGEYTPSGTLIAQYNYGLGLISQTDTNGMAAYYAFDAVGNTHNVVTNGGLIANAYAYSPFGALLQSKEIIRNPFEYIGQFGVMGEGGSRWFMRERHESDFLGRFLSEDPLGPGIGSEGTNMYRYVRGNPLSYTDVMGLYSNAPPLWDIRAQKKYVMDLSGKHWILGTIAGTLFDISPLQAAQDFGENLGQGHYWLAAYNLVDYGLSFVDFKVPKWIDRGRYRLVAVDDMLKYEMIPLSERKALNPKWIAAEFKDIFDLAKSAASSWLSGQSSNPRPVDPNAKTGPVGAGSGGYITPAASLAYRIDFENESKATAPAQSVTVTDQLSSNLDWSTFELTEIGFGDQLVAVPPKTQYFETAVPLTYNGVDFEVWIYAGVNPATGKLTAQFYSIDPDTELPPSVLIGFLPPEDGTGRGMAHISYIIRLKPGLPTGTQIRNIAQITFDRGETIATNQKNAHNPAAGTDPAKEALNTIDASMPTSYVNPLPAHVTPDFTVSWQGSNDPGGSGLKDYSIYVSDNGGPYAPWLANTTDTSATFTGQIGHTYSFYSMTRNNVGTQQAAPAAPATASVAIKPAVTSDPANSIGPISATLHATINPGGSNTTAYFEYGLSTSYGYSTTPQSVGSGSSPLPFAQTITGFDPGMIYHFRAGATNTDGTTWGGDQEFTTTCASYQLPVNGHFCAGLQSWTTEISQGCGGTRTVGVLDADQPYANVLQIKSLAAGACAGSSGVSQDLDLDVARYDAIVLSGAVKAVSASIPTCGANGTDTPLAIRVHYEDTDQQAKILSFLLYFDQGGKCGSPTLDPAIQYVPLQIPQDQWYAFNSGNLKWRLPGASRITKIELLSSGWDYEARVDDLRLVAGRHNDFDGDGKADILWRHAVYGDINLWFMNGSVVTSDAWLPRVTNLQWQIAGIGDFDGDGHPDILWRNAATGDLNVWYMDGTTVTSDAWLPPVADPQWQIAGIGDFNGDGKADIVWRHATYGDIDISFMNGATVTGDAWLPRVTDPRWQIAGIGDFNGDGDILWRYTPSGDLNLWLMNGITIVSDVWLPRVADPQWQINAIGDFNGDGNAEIVWRHAVYGCINIWFMNGATVVSDGWLPTVSDLRWRIFGPR